MRFLVLILLSVLCFGVRAQPDTIHHKLENYSRSFPQEKVHLHTDKPYYSVGDTIWMKAYLVNAEQNMLSAMSRVLYVNLVNENDSVCLGLNLPVMQGIAFGQFTLPPNLTEGRYRLQAYTNWMRNFDPSGFFNKELRIGNVLNDQILVSADFNYDNSAQVLNTSLALNNLNSSPLNNQAVKYTLLDKDKVIATGTGSTDSQGKIELRSTPKWPRDKQLLIRIILQKGNIEIKKELYYKPGLPGPDIRFFPESGYLVQNIRSLVGIKAVGTDGKGLALSGVIKDDQGLELTTVNTLHAGMGSFALTPVPGRKYQAHISLGDGTSQVIKLPEAALSGYVLSVNAVTDSTNIVLTAKRSVDLSAQPLTVIAHQNGAVIYAATSAAGTSLLSKIPKSSLRSGIVHFTLFNGDRRPVAQRLVFVRRDDSLRLTATTLRDYSTRDSVILGIQVLDSVKVGTFSAAVINNSDVGSNEEEETTIFSNLLLSSDLRGFIENPSYYFQGQRQRELDNLMLTQGWIRFNWDNVLSGTFPETRFPVEKSLSLRGNVKTFNGKTLPGSGVRLFTKLKESILLLDTISDSRGNFEFNDLPVTDTARILLSAKGQNKSANIVLSIDSNTRPVVTESMPGAGKYTTRSMLNFLQRTAERFNEMAGNMDRGYTLREVVVTSGLKQSPIPGSAHIPLSAPADIVIPRDKMQGSTSIFEVLRRAGLTDRGGKFLNFGRDEADGNRKEGMVQFYLNGMPFPQSELAGIAPMALEGIEYIRAGFQSAAYEQTYGKSAPTTQNTLPEGPVFGVVLLTMTKTPYYNRESNTLTLAMKGYDYPREFYAPVYKVDDTIKDLRSTIYWKPDILTDSTGKYVIRFRNSDSKGIHKIIIEGISVDGKLARKVLYYSVK